MDDFASVLRKGLAGAGKGAPILTAGLIAGLVYAIGLFYSVDLTSVDVATSLISTLITFIPLIVIPYVVGGALGYALEASSGGDPGWPTFFASARKHYASLFFAGIAIYLLFNLAAIVLVAGAIDVILLCTVFLLTIIALLAVLMFLEFYDIAIVSGDMSAMEGLRASVAFVQKNLRRVIPFFLIVLISKALIMIPLYTAEALRVVADIAANYQWYFNNTTTGEVNMTYLNSTIAAGATPMSAPMLTIVAVLQILLQMIVFSFVISYKVEFWRWGKSIKSITDFDYDFSDEKRD
jgi:hypothetical protein